MGLIVSRDYSPYVCSSDAIEKTGAASASSGPLNVCQALDDNLRKWIPGLYQGLSHATLIPVHIRVNDDAVGMCN